MRQRIEQIDALRGLAALGVAVFFHAFYVQGRIFHGPGEAFLPLHWLYQWGWTLVDLFFVISGYVFAHVYLDERGELRTGVTFRSFWIARIARLYPLHFATLVLCMTLAAIATATGVPDYSSNGIARFAMNLAFLQALSGGVNVPSWSLSVEAFCYLLFIVAALMDSLRRFAPALVVLGLAMVAFAHGEIWTAISSFFGRGLIGFFVGYHLWRWRSLPIPRALLVPVVAISPFASGIGTTAYDVLLLFTLWPALVRLALTLPCPAFLKWLGDRSYSIYLVHFPLYMAVHIVLRGNPPEWPVATMIACAVGILLLADISYRWFELPAKRFILREPFVWPKALQIR